MTSQHRAVAAARRHRTDSGHAILAEFVKLLDLPNVSRDLAAVSRNAGHIVEMLRKRGIDATAVRIEGAAPAVIGRLDIAGATTTLGFYAHYDGQPVDRGDWKVEPFEPSLFTAPFDDGGSPIPLPAPGDDIDPEWRLYARSAADDKAPIVALCAALDAFAAHGIVPGSNLVFLFEGEEEIGSPHLGAYLDDHAATLAADVWFICDGPVHVSRRPQVGFGVRGIAEMELTVYGPVRPLHSGHYGNWARNPNLELARLLASMKDDDGTVLVDGFYDGTEPINAADRAAAAALPDDDALRAELGLGSTEGDGEPLALRLLLPSLNVRGIDGGSVGEAAANVIPTQASASIDIRLAPGNDPEVMMDRVEHHIASRGWTIVSDVPDADARRRHGNVVRIDRKASYPGVRLPMDSPLAAAVAEAAAIAAGQDVLAIPTFGGSVPLHHFTSVLGSAVALTPFANHDNNQHAANENLRIGNLWYGIDLMAALATFAPPR